MDSDLIADFVDVNIKNARSNVAVAILAFFQSRILRLSLHWSSDDLHWSLTVADFIRMFLSHSSP